MVTCKDNSLIAQHIPEVIRQFPSHFTRGCGKTTMMYAFAAVSGDYFSERAIRRELLKKFKVISDTNIRHTRFDISEFKTRQVIK